MASEHQADKNILNHLLHTKENKHIIHNHENDVENIYKLKYLKSQTDKVLPDDFQPGSFSGVFLNNKLNNLDRFHESKALFLKADHIERSLLTTKFDCFRKVLQRRSLNIGLKAFLGLVFINAVLNRNHKIEKIQLNGSTSIACPMKAIVSFAAFVGSVVYL